MQPTSLAFAIAAAAAAFVLLQSGARAVAVIALIAAGVEIAMALDIISLKVSGISLPLILGAILAATGIYLYMKVGAKLHVTCATILTAIGALQVLTALGII